MDLLPRFPPDVPNRHGRFQYTLEGMLSSWFTFITFPAAVLTYAYTQSISWTLLAFFFLPIYTFCQGAILVLNYRLSFRDCPLPISPAHGVVVVSPRDNAEKNDGDDDTAVRRKDCATSSSCSCSCRGGQRWRGHDRTTLNHDDSSILNRALQDEEPPLRLLVLGDSLALGVGTHESCTALLPEVVAKTLSKQMGGRAVHWTSHGQPGASVGWIVRELQRVTKKRTLVQDNKGDVHRCKDKDDVCSASQYSIPEDAPRGLLLSETSSLSSSSSVVSTSSDESSEGLLSFDSMDALEDVDASPDDFSEWRRRLAQQRKSFAPDVSGPYDIVIVMTGANDLKSTVFPMLVGGEEGEFRKNAQRQGLSLTNELQRVVQALEPCMSNKDTSSNDLPLIVFPGMPTGLLPIFRRLPLRWLAIPSMGTVENHKIRVADKNDHVMFVPSPTMDQAMEFEAQQGTLWNQRLKEDALLALRDVTPEECRAKSETLKQYHMRKGGKPFHPTSAALATQANVPHPPLSERDTGLNGSKIVFLDDIHPNDEGYDFWGRHIATGILQQWQQQRRQVQQ